MNKKNFERSHLWRHIVLEAVFRGTLLHVEESNLMRPLSTTLPTLEGIVLPRSSDSWILKRHGLERDFVVSSRSFFGGVAFSLRQFEWDGDSGNVHLASIFDVCNLYLHVKHIGKT